MSDTIYSRAVPRPTFSPEVFHLPLPLCSGATDSHLPKNAPTSPSLSPKEVETTFPEREKDNSSSRPVLPLLITRNFLQTHTENEPPFAFAARQHP